MTFFKAQKTLPPELKAVYDYLRKHGEQASSQIAAGLDIHQNTALKRLNRLMDADLVVKKGKGPKSTASFEEQPSVDKK